MQHLSSLDQIHLNAAWVTIGSYDGVHRAHQKIIGGLVAGAHAQNLPAVVITFFPILRLFCVGVRAPFT